jgi:hypothetical protein
MQVEFFRIARQAECPRGQVQDASMKGISGLPERDQLLLICAEETKERSKGT